MRWSEPFFLIAEKGAMVGGGGQVRRAEGGWECKYACSSLPSKAVRLSPSTSASAAHLSSNQ